MENSTSMKVVEKPEWTCRFKKHKGKPLSQVWAEDPQYIQWLMTEPWVDSKLKGYITKQRWYDVCPDTI